MYAIQLLITSTIECLIKEFNRNIFLSNVCMLFLLQTNVDRRDDKHFEDGSGPSHGKRHRQRVSPHRYLKNGAKD